MFTGQRLKGRDVLRAGIATHLCNSSRIEELQEMLCSIEIPNHENVSDVLDKFTKESTFDIDKEFVLKPYITQIEESFSGNTVDDIFKNLEKVIV